MRSTGLFGGGEVSQAARERLFDAMLVELAEKGYREAALEGALTRAGIADAEPEFEDKDACLFAAYGYLSERLLGRATERCESEEAWPRRVQHGLEALLDDLAARPEMAKVLTRTFPSIRPATYGLYMAFLEAFAPFLSGGRECSGMTEELPDEVEMLAVGAAEAIVFEEIEAGRAAQLPSLMPSILFSVLVPFIGPDEAAAAMERAKKP
jgi:hypothetical protein